jgi:CRP-like cAMP-binding protein
MLFCKFKGYLIISMVDLVLQNISKYITLTAQESDLFVSLLHARTYKRKDYILALGDICRYDTFITQGCVKVCYLDNEGLEHIVKFALEDWWVVDLNSFINRTPAFYYIQALEDTQVFQLSKSNYDFLHHTIPTFEKFSHTRWQQGFIALQQRIMQNLSLDAKTRYLHFLQKYPTLEQRISQKQIAAYLGITPEFLSMIRRKLMEEHYS